MDNYIPLLAIPVGILIYLRWIQRPANYPPGPTGLPLLGNLLQVGEKPFVKFHKEWRHKYGPIIGLQFGSYKAVAITDYKLIREAMLEPGLQGRPNMPAWHVRSQDVKPRGIIFTEGQENMEQRRIALRGIKDFGYSNKSFEDVVTSEALSLMENLREKEERPISLKNNFHVYMLNIVWRIVAGKGCEEDRQSLSKIYMDCTKILEEQSYLTSLFMFMPWLCEYLPGLSGFTKNNRQLVPIWNFLQRHIDEHQKNDSETPHDFLGSYIQEMRRAESDSTSSFYKLAGERNLMTSLLDFFFAGTDTTATMIHWICLYLATHVQAQEAMQEEIDNVIGQSRLSQMNDEQHMPYTLAVINETLRITSLAPMAIFHSAMQDVKFHGYVIPKDTIVFLNLYGAHQDEEYWGDPQEFRPERFLSEDKHSLLKHDAFFPFGYGKRSCVGEVLARMEMFLFITTIFQKYCVTPDPENPNPYLEGIPTLLMFPPNHKLVFTKRN